MTRAPNTRALGLVVQVVAVLSIFAPLAQLALMRGELLDRHLLVPLGICAIELYAGRSIARGERWAAFVWLAAAIAGAVWLVMPHGMAAPQASLMAAVVESAPRGLQIVTTVAAMTSWPLVVAIVVWRAPVAERTETERRPEAGGVLVGYGAMLLVKGAIGAVGGVLVIGHFPAVFLGALLIPELVDLAVGLLAIRAGRELVMANQHGRSRLLTLVRVALVAYPLATVGALAMFWSDQEVLGARYFIIASVQMLVTKLAPLYLIRWHAGHVERHAVEVGAPDPEAAAAGLGWAMLWFAVVMLATLPAIFEKSEPAIVLVVGGAIVALAAACIAAFITTRRVSRRRMLAAIVAAVLAGLVLLVSVGFGFSERAFSVQGPFILVIAIVTVGTTLARLHRPSLRGQRGLGSVFE